MQSLLRVAFIKSTEQHRIDLNVLRDILVSCLLAAITGRDKLITLKLYLNAWYL